MANYLGNDCPVCAKKFVDGDDIVVCPVCGAPHHRACYALENHCAFENEHITGKAWKPKIEPQQSTGDFCINPQDGKRWETTESDGKICGFCGSKNPQDNIFCCFCGNKIGVQPTTNNPNPYQTANPSRNNMGLDPAGVIFGGVAPMEDIGGFPARELATFVGRSSGVYLQKFKAESINEKNISFNLPAFFLSYFYFFYRKMYKVGALFLAVALLISVPQMLYTIEYMPVIFKESVGTETLSTLGIDIESEIQQVDNTKIKTYETMNSAVNIINILVHLFAGFFGNKLYYKHALQKLSSIKNDEATKGVSVGAIDHERTVANAGGVNVGSVIVLVSLMFISSFATVLFFYWQYMI